jgi:hypothetical protein
MRRIEFKINDSEGHNASAIVRLNDIIDIVVRGPVCTISTGKFEYMTTSDEYIRIQKALVDSGNILSEYKKNK